MSRDPIVDEVRRPREKEAAKHGFDSQANRFCREKASTAVGTPGCIACPNEPEIDGLNPAKCGGRPPSARDPIWATPRFFDRSQLLSGRANRPA